MADKIIAKKSSRKFQNFMNFVAYNEVLTPTLFLCIKEFYDFLSELQVAAYDGAARTLRCILETATEACEFQTEDNRATCTNLMEKYYAVVSSRGRKRFERLLVDYNAWVAFMERYRLYEKTKRIAPTFKELVNNLKSRELFQEAPKASDEFKNIYEKLSDYVHPSSTKFADMIEKKKRPSFRSFKAKEFDTIWELGLKTLDLVQFLYIKSIAYFFDFKNGKDFLKDLSKRQIFSTKIAADFFLSLPFSKRLSSRVKWRIEKKLRSQKKRARKT